MLKQIEAISKEEIFERAYSPDFTNPYEWARRPEGYFGKMSYANPDDKRPNARTLYIQINFDGSANLFCGRAAEIYSGEETKYFFPKSLQVILQDF